MSELGILAAGARQLTDRPVAEAGACFRVDDYQLIAHVIVLALHVYGALYVDHPLELLTALEAA